MKFTEHLSVTDPSGIGEIRRVAVRLAEGLGFDEELKGRVAIVLNELSSNMLKHAKGGEIIAVSEQKGDVVKLDIFAYDQGPGMDNVHRCMQDGYSTSGTVGGGLGAISRLPNLFDIYSRPGKGTAIYCSFRLNHPAQPRSMEWGGLNLVYPGELVSGDDYAYFDSPDFSVVTVVDGIGHGNAAHEAAQLAVKTFCNSVDQSSQEILSLVHKALVGSRGAAVAIARIDHVKNELTYSALGNIAGQILLPETSQSLMSLDGIAGQIARRIQTVTYPWSPQAVLMMHSDGLSSRNRFDHETYPGIALRHPALIAGVLMRDAKRGRDDATVLVGRSNRGREKS